MPKWTTNDNRIFDNSTGWCSFTAGPGFAAAIVERHNSDIDALIARTEVAEMRLKKAMSLLADNRLNLGIHSSHWDDTMQGGRGCRVCIEQREIMNEICELESEINGRQ